MNELRPDQNLIARWIRPHSHILDLGCGDGRMLDYLRKHSHVTGYGVEIEEDNVAQCIAKGIDVVQSDLDKGLSDFGDNSFDYVVMSQTLQMIRQPAKIIQEMLRVGHEGIVTFTNMGFWKHRWDLVIKGVSPTLGDGSHPWYATPNANLCTMKDFEILCKRLGMRIIQKSTTDYKHQSNFENRMMPNLMGEIAIYRFYKIPKDG